MTNKHIDQIIDKYEADASALIQILLQIQRENHWLPQQALEQISRKLEVPLSRIMHIATFYKAFSLVPRGRHEVHICMGTACHVRGAKNIMNCLYKDLEIKEGETTDDLMFTLESVRCMGCCASGPVIRVNKDTHGGLDPDRIIPVITQYREGTL